MIVSELINHLRTLDPSLPVVTRGYEVGVEDVEIVEATHTALSPDAAEEWAGAWQVVDPDRGTRAVYIGSRAWLTGGARGYA